MRTWIFSPSRLMIHVGTMNAPTREEAATRPFTEQIRSVLGPNLIELRLFGSRARGTARPDSDIDVLVVVRDNRVTAENHAIDVAFDVNLEHDVYVSPRVVTDASLRDPVWRTTLFVQTLSRERVPL